MIRLLWSIRFNRRINLRRDRVISNTLQHLLERFRIEGAAREIELLRQLFSLLEQVVRNGNGGFHTKSITLSYTKCQT